LKKFIHELNKGFQSKKHISQSNVDDKSLIWKIVLLFVPLSMLVFFPNCFEECSKVFLFIVGFVLIFLSAKKLLRSDVRKSWYKTQGEVLYHKAAIDNPYASEHVRSYFPYIRYSYKVKNRLYKSDKVAEYRELKDYPEEIEYLINSISRPELNVYYNPKKPDQSLLIPNLPLHRLIYWIFLVMIGIGSLVTAFII
jgi:hypothetical protein